jgi:DNA-binding response OmpR family regulator
MATTWLTACTGLEAVSVLRSAPQAVDLVLTDVMMPFLDGFGLLKEIRSRDQMKMLPVIMLSARAGEEASAEGLAEGADDYLTKPFTARELLSRVASHLNMSRVRNDAARTEMSLRAKVHFMGLNSTGNQGNVCFGLTGNGARAR